MGFAFSNPRYDCKHRFTFNMAEIESGPGSLGPIPLVINGRHVVTDTTFPVISPVSMSEVWTCSSAGPDHVSEAVSSAKAAFPAWSATKPSTRRDIFLRAADIIAQRKEELGRYMHQEIGADKAYQDFILGLSIEGLKDTAGRIAGAVQGEVPVSNHDGMRAITYKRPFGVVLGIGPW
jgi:acyl-CoA reductase-like NAD-dependent aldehyde dehydrogenase